MLHVSQSMTDAVEAYPTKITLAEANANNANVTVALTSAKQKKKYEDFAFYKNTYYENHGKGKGGGKKSSRGNGKGRGRDKGLAKEEKASRKVRRVSVRADAVLEITRSRKIKLML